MLQPMKNERTRPATAPKPYGNRKKSRRDHPDYRFPEQDHDHGTGSLLH